MQGFTGFSELNFIHFEISSETWIRQQAEVVIEELLQINFYDHALLGYNNLS